MSRKIAASWNHVCRERADVEDAGKG